MPNAPKILAFAGSAREASFNKTLVKIAAEGAKAAGGEVPYIDLRDLPMPLFDQDLEAKEGLPENVLKFKELMMAHRGFLIASPEYNGSIALVTGANGGIGKEYVDSSLAPLSTILPM
jgi:NAD(P)H-dependent FMN reductase